MLVLDGAPLGRLGQTFTQRFLVLDAKTGAPITWGANIRVYSIRTDELVGKGYTDEKGGLVLPLNIGEDEPIKIMTQAGEYGEFLSKGITGEDPVTIKLHKPEAVKDEKTFPTLPVLGAGVIVLGIVLYHLLG